jgi:hypothetical protein
VLVAALLAWRRRWLYSTTFGDVTVSKTIQPPSRKPATPWRLRRIAPRSPG